MLTAEAFFTDAHTLPLAPLEQIVGARGIVVVAPHPDDETLGCGGLIALAHAEGRSIRILVLSDGCGSHPNSRTHSPDRLREVRENEARSAVAALGPDPAAVAFLRLPDRFLPSDGAAAEAAAEKIVVAAKDIRASAILTTWRHDPHCDHQAAWRIATLAKQALPDDVALVAFPIWGWSLPPQATLPERPQGWRLAIENQAPLKQRAIAAYLSQTSTLIDNEPPVLILNEETLARFKQPYELFFGAES